MEEEYEKVSREAAAAGGYAALAKAQTSTTVFGQEQEETPTTVSGESNEASGESNEASGAAAAADPNGKRRRSEEGSGRKTDKKKERMEVDSDDLLGEEGEELLEADEGEESLLGDIFTGK